MKVEIEWIPCAKRLPDDDERALIVVDGDWWGATVQTDEDGPVWATDDGTTIADGRVSHWARAEVPNG